MQSQPAKPTATADNVTGALEAQRSSAAGRSLPKNQRASERGDSMGMLYSATERSIALQAVAGWGPALLFTYGVVLGVAGAGMLFAGLSMFEKIHRNTLGLGYQLLDAIFGGIFLTLAFIALSMAIKAFRLCLNRALVEPIVFNRATRQVHIWHHNIGAHIFSDLLRPFKSWPMELDSYHWDCIEAEDITTLVPGGNVARPGHRLALWVKASPTSSELVACLDLGPGIAHNEHSVNSLWEYVRAYMEANGPALPPGDEPANVPANGWQAALGTVPLLAIGYAAVLGWLRYSQGSLSWPLLWSMASQPASYPALAVMLFTLGLFTVSVIGYVLAHQFAPRPAFPAELAAQAGPALNLHNLRKARPAKA
jgi:hypothetical protein